MPNHRGSAFSAFAPGPFSAGGEGGQSFGEAGGRGFLALGGGEPDEVFALIGRERRRRSGRRRPCSFLALGRGRRAWASLRVFAEGGGRRSGSASRMTAAWRSLRKVSRGNFSKVVRRQAANPGVVFGRGEEIGGVVELRCRGRRRWRRVFAAANAADELASAEAEVVPFDGFGEVGFPTDDPSAELLANGAGEVGDGFDPAVGVFRGGTMAVHRGQRVSVKAPSENFAPLIMTSTRWRPAWCLRVVKSRMRWRLVRMTVASGSRVSSFHLKTLAEVEPDFWRSGWRSRRRAFEILGGGDEFQRHGDDFAEADFFGETRKDFTFTSAVWPAPMTARARRSPDFIKVRRAWRVTQAMFLFSRSHFSMRWRTHSGWFLVMSLRWLATDLRT